MTSRYPLRGAQQIGAAQCSHGDVHVQILLPLFEQLLRLYLSMHLHVRVPIKTPVTLTEHCISHSARFKNTMIELLKTSTDPQISNGVGALKPLFPRKKRTGSCPLLSPLPKMRAS